MNLQRLDHHFILKLRHFSIPFARFAIFIVYFWFGILKVLGLSPASGIVTRLAQMTLPFLPTPLYVILFGWFEVLLAVLFLFPRLTRIVLPLLLLHLVTTFMPLILLPQESWSGFLVPTLEGQYIIKNVLIVASAMVIAAHLIPIEVAGKRRDDRQ